MKIGNQVKFRNGEIVTIKDIRSNKNDFVVMGTGKQFKAGQHKTFVLEFDDGEITIAHECEIEVL